MLRKLNLFGSAKSNAKKNQACFALAPFQNALNYTSQVIFGAPSWCYISQLPIILGAKNQLTKFERHSDRLDIHPLEKGDHVLVKIDEMKWFIWNMTMLMRIRSDGTYNNGLNKIETKESYYQRVIGEQIPLLINVMKNNPDFDGATIAEGVIDDDHVKEFEALIQFHLPDCRYLGPTNFGLGILLRKKNQHQDFIVDHDFIRRLKSKELHSRCITVIDTVNCHSKKIAIHTPHGKKNECQVEKKYYAEIVRAIYLDMLAQTNPDYHDAVQMNIFYVHAGKEHLKGNGELHGVSGGAKFTLTVSGKKSISYEVTGDFNLTLNSRQHIDKKIFDEIKQSYYCSEFSQDIIANQGVNLFSLIYGIGFIYAMHSNLSEMDSIEAKKALVFMNPAM